MIGECIRLENDYFKEHTLLFVVRNLKIFFLTQVLLLFIHTVYKCVCVYVFVCVCVCVCVLER